MPWILRDGEVLAALEIAQGRKGRRKGLLGRDGIDGALLLFPARSVHTVGLHFDIDVAWCRAVGAVGATGPTGPGDRGPDGEGAGPGPGRGSDRRFDPGALGAFRGEGGVIPAAPGVLVVLDVATLRPCRISLPRPRARCVLEAEAGAFARWSLRPGDRLEVR